MVSISIAMTTCNGALFLRGQLESLAAQTRLPLELQVGDDCSSDRTLEILEDFRRKAPFPVVVHRNFPKLGITENFLATAGRCAGDWIAFCDQDDVWLPQKLARCARGIERGPSDLKLVAHNATIVFEGESRRYLKTFWRGADYRPRLGLPPHWSCAGFTQVFRRDLLTILPDPAARALRQEGVRDGHDYWIPTLAAATGSILLLGAPLALYRRHGNNVTPAVEQEPRSRSRKIWRALRANGQAYSDEADVASRIAALLDEASAVADKESRALLADAATRLRSFSGANLKRSLIYADRYRHRRIGMLKDLLLEGAYRRSPAPSFGPRAFLKDLAYALFLPVGRGPPPSG
ncbi:MAG TPA: glycosyltransferase [Allosphingosinicella sp.]|jgi:glycosyltransferase involved in cell wall biosynthesis